MSSFSSVYIFLPEIIQSTFFQYKRTKGDIFAEQCKQKVTFHLIKSLI